MVQDAVKKLLLGGAGDNKEGLLKGLDTSAILAQVKQEKVDREDSDSDCMIVEEIVPAPAATTTTVKTVKVEEEADCVTLADFDKPKLYLPPSDCPVYKP